MSKISLIFVLLCVTVTVVQCGSPASKSGNKEISTGQIIVKAGTQVFKALGSYLWDVGYKVRRAFSNLASDVALAFVLRTHLMLAAVGISNEEIIPYDLNEKYYTMAASTAKLCGKLNAMEKCINIVMNSSLETAEYLRHRGVMMGHSRRFAYYTNQIESKINNDSELSALYKQIKANLPVMKYMDLKEAQNNHTMKREAGIQAIKFLLYKMQVQHSYLNMLTMFKKEHRVTARSVYELAKKTDKSEALQMIYDQTMTEVIDSVDKYHLDVIFDPSSILYTKLEEKISSKPELKGEYEEIKKMVEKSSEWTVRLFDVDLLPW